MKLVNSLLFITMLTVSFETPSPLASSSAEPDEPAAAAGVDKRGRDAAVEEESGEHEKETPVTGNVMVLVTDGVRFLSTRKHKQRAWYPGEAKRTSTSKSITTVFEVEFAPEQIVTFHASAKNASDKTNQWGIPGGDAKTGEGIRTAGTREFWEETFVDLETLEPKPIFSTETFDRVRTNPDTEEEQPYQSHGLIVVVKPGQLTPIEEKISLRLKKATDLKKTVFKRLNSIKCSIYAGEKDTDKHEIFNTSDVLLNTDDASLYATFLPSMTQKIGHNVKYTGKIVRLTWEELREFTKWVITDTLPVLEDELWKCNCVIMRTIADEMVEDSDKGGTKYKYNDWTRELVKRYLKSKKAEAEASKRARPAAKR